MNGTPLRVVLIEDNPGDARLMQEALRDSPDNQFAIEWFDTLAAGLARIQRGQADVILLDLSLPDSKGIDTFIRMQRQAQGIPILVLTGLDDEAMATRAVKEGAQDYLVKSSIDGNLLVRSLRYAIERQRIEEELRRVNALHSSILKVLPFGMEIVDEHGRIMYIAGKFASQLGKEAIGKTCWEIYKDDKIQCFDCALKSPIKIGEVRSIETENALGGKVFQIIHIGIMYEGRKAILEIFNDITERKRIEQLKSDFVALVSHQLKAPIGQLSGYIDNMLAGITGTVSEKQRQYLTDMKVLSVRSYRLISDLLNVSRIERGIVSVSLQPVNLRRVVETALHDYRGQICDKGLLLSLEGFQEDIIVMADEDKLVEAISNVVNNAVKFTAGGSITVRISRLPEYGMIEVQDTGRGISPELLGRLFTRDQALSGTAMADTGAGLGLYIAKNFMILQHGDITVDPSCQKGSKFVFKIPLNVI